MPVTRRLTAMVFSRRFSSRDNRTLMKGPRAPWENTGERHGVLDLQVLKKEFFPLIIYFMIIIFITIIVIIILLR